MLQFQSLSETMQDARRHGGLGSSLPPTRPIDPRLLIDSEGQTPFMRARGRNHITLVNILNPFTPLTEIFDHMEVGGLAG